MKIVKGAMLLFIGIILMPLIVRVLGGIDTDCRPIYISRYDLLNLGVCEEMGNEFVDDFLKHTNKFLDQCIEYAVIFGDNVEELLLQAYERTIYLFYRKKNSIVEKIYSLGDWFKISTTKNKKLKAFNILIPYANIDNTKIGCWSPWKPTCLTTVLGKLLVLLLNPVFPLLALIVYLLHEYVYGFVERKM